MPEAKACQHLIKQPNSRAFVFDLEYTLDNTHARAAHTHNITSIHACTPVASAVTLRPTSQVRLGVIFVILRDSHRMYIV